jgi:hypothetical protein
MDPLNGHVLRIREDLQALLSLYAPFGTLCCPAHHPLYPQERRQERNGSLQVLYAARIGHCRSYPLREHCQENGTATLKPRRVSAVFWPVSSCPSVSVEPPSAPIQPLLSPTPCPVLWGDWERCQIRRRWLRGIRMQTVILTPGSVQQEEEEDGKYQEVQTRAQRAHWRLGWDERLVRNARASTAPPLELTIHGLPATFARSFGFGLVAAA